MVWGASCYKFVIGGLEGAAGSADAQYYTTLLEVDLLTAVNDAIAEMWTLQQAMAPFSLLPIL